MIINNCSELNKIMVFEPGTYYKFAVMQRKKDGNIIFQDKDRKEIIVKQWLIDTPIKSFKSSCSIGGLLDQLGK